MRCLVVILPYTVIKWPTLKLSSKTNCNKLYNLLKQYVVCTISSNDTRIRVRLSEQQAEQVSVDRYEQAYEIELHKDWCRLQHKGRFTVTTRIGQ